MKSIREKWYAAFVMTGKEEKVKKHLDHFFSNRMKTFIPKRMLHERKNGQWNFVFRPLFPGYVLINGDVGLDDYYNCKNIPSLLRLLHNEHELLSLSPEEALVINNLLFEGEIIRSSSILKSNDNIFITSGPLTGMEGSIVKIDPRKGRVKARIVFLGQERIINLAAEFIEKQVDKHKT